MAFQDSECAFVMIKPLSLVILGSNPGRYGCLCSSCVSLASVRMRNVKYDGNESKVHWSTLQQVASHLLAEILRHISNLGYSGFFKEYQQG